MTTTQSNTQKTYWQIRNDYNPALPPEFINAKGPKWIVIQKCTAKYNAIKYTGEEYLILSSRCFPFIISSICF